MELEYNPEWFKEYRNIVPQGEEPKDSTAEVLRESIIVSNLYLCKRVVGKMKKSMPSHVERDDLESWAKIGLLQAVTRFDASFGVPFEAFATQRMRSVIMDGIRDADWAPRSLRKKQRDINKAEETYRQEQGIDPSNEQIAEMLDFSIEEVSNTRYQSEIAAHTYIEGSLEAQNKPVSLNEEEDELVAVLKATLGKALEDLPVRQAAIIALHYYDEKKLSDIAEKLNMSEVKIGELHSEAVLSLWEKLQNVLADA